MTAVRLARAATGRDKIVKFAGHYHGHVDGLLAESGSGLATQGIPASPGVTAGAGGRHDRGAVERHAPPSRRRSTTAVAAVLAEPIAGEHGTGAAARGLPGAAARALRRGRRAARPRRGDHRLPRRARWRPGAARRAARPDDPRQGAGRRPAARGGRRAAREIMEQLAPVGQTYQAGTLSGNPLATAAGLATLGELDERRVRAARRDHRAPGATGCGRDGVQVAGRDRPADRVLRGPSR